MHHSIHATSNQLRGETLPQTFVERLKSCISAECAVVTADEEFDEKYGCIEAVWVLSTSMKILMGDDDDSSLLLLCWHRGGIDEDMFTSVDVPVTTHSWSRWRGDESFCDMAMINFVG